jgi:hypothetical protein
MPIDRRSVVDRTALAYHQRKPHPQAKRGPHKWTGRILHYPYCSECGLIRLSNDTTRACIAWGCWHMPD